MVSSSSAKTVRSSVSIEHSSSHCTAEEEIAVEISSFIICETKPPGSCTALCRQHRSTMKISLCVGKDASSVSCRHTCSTCICGSVNSLKMCDTWICVSETETYFWWVFLMKILTDLKSLWALQRKNKIRVYQEMKRKEVRLPSYLVLQNVCWRDEHKWKLFALQQIMLQVQPMHFAHLSLQLQLSAKLSGR